MRAIIVEDNPIELKHIRNLLEKFNGIDVIAEVLDSQVALSMIKKLKPHVVFLDISMPGICGLELARKLKGKVVIVFITAHYDLALKAFEVGSTDYIVKPIDVERLKVTIDRISKLLINGNKDNKNISLTINGKIILIDVDKILFIEKVPILKKITIHTENKDYIISENLNVIEKKLLGCGFMRSHKSFIININKIESMIPWGDKSYLAKMLGTKKDVLISRKYAPIIKSMISFQ